MVPTTLRPSHGLLVAVMALALAVPLLSSPPPAAAQGTGLADGDPATTERVDTDDPITAAVTISQGRFEGGAPHAVLATTATFADSLAGAALSADGPLLLTDPEVLPDATAEELGRVLADGATVYVLGGVEAIGDAVEQAVTDAGLVPVRLAGETRVETALAIADEVRRLTPGEGVLLARSEAAPGNPTSAWADSVPGGALAAATGTPILVTPTEGVHPAVAAWLAADAPAAVTLLGGEAALSADVADAMPGSRRLAGPERTATAAAIAAAWPDAAGTRYTILDGGREDGWAFGLSAAGAAADAGAPVLLVVDRVTAETRRLVSACGDPAVDLLLVGSADVIGAGVESTLTELDGAACAADFAALRTFDDCSATLDYFVDEGLERVGPYGLDGYWYGAQPVPEPGTAMPVDDTADDGGSSPEPSPEAPASDGEESAVGGGGEAATDVSGTNVQELGVDEPDRVKTDGRAIYTIDGNQVHVTDVTGPAPAHLTTVEVPDAGYAGELLLHDDVLMVISRGDSFAYPTEPTEGDVAFAPQPYYPEPTTRLTRYDVSDPASPRLLDAAEIGGDSRSARMVDGVVRLVVLANPTGLDFTFPAEDTDEARADALAHNRSVIEQSEIEDWLPNVTADGITQPLVPCGAVFAPPGFSGVSTAMVAAVHIADSTTPTSAAAVVAQAEVLYASTQRLVLTSSRWGTWNPDSPPEAVTTEVHSFDIADPDATGYVGSGQVDGYVLNSFAISERNAYYRIATTTEPPWDGSGTPGTTDNGITILTEGGSELFQVGRVAGLGEGERIFAVRYLGDVAAVVTFQQIDPLYLVDLTDPSAPRVTGELKIPGVSNYLHPVGPDHLLGVGQDGDDDGRLTGVQVSLFDISDSAAPTRVDSLELGPGYSPVDGDHRAFLWWAPAGRAFVPAYLESGTSGVQVIDVDPAAGTLGLAGRIGPPDSGYGSPDRTAIVDDTVFTVGYSGVSAHDLAGLTDQGFAAFPGGDDSSGGSDPESPPPPDEPTTDG